MAQAEEFVIVGNNLKGLRGIEPLAFKPGDQRYGKVLTATCAQGLKWVLKAPTKSCGSLENPERFRYFSPYLVPLERETYMVEHKKEEEEAKDETEKPEVFEYICMPFYDGSLLGLAFQGLSRKDQARLSLELLLGVRDLARRYVHRDIKPHNAFTYEDCGILHLVLGDFDIAAQYTGVSQNLSRGATTYGYCYPWLTPLHGCSPFEDIYSLGMMLYMLYTERWLPIWDPHEVERIIKTKGKTENDPEYQALFVLPEKARAELNKVSPALSDIVSKCLCSKTKQGTNKGWELSDDYVTKNSTAPVEKVLKAFKSFVREQGFDPAELVPQEPSFRAPEEQDKKWVCVEKFRDDLPCPAPSFVALYPNTMTRLPFWVGDNNTEAVRYEEIPYDIKPRDIKGRHGDVDDLLFVGLEDGKPCCWVPEPWYLQELALDDEERHKDGFIAKYSYRYEFTASNGDKIRRSVTCRLKPVE